MCIRDRAIFLDAHAVCGDTTLLEEVRNAMFDLTFGNDAMLARFAAAIHFFGSSQGWWNRLLNLGDKGDDQLDLKKVGIFPLVHGVRSLALAQRLTEVSTVARIEALVAGGKLPDKLGADLIDSLHFFMGLKLKAGLQELDTGRAVSPHTACASRKMASSIRLSGLAVTDHRRTIWLKSLTLWRQCGLLTMMLPGQVG